MKLKTFSRRIFKLISFAYPQNKETKRYLKKLGVKAINYIGNLKFYEDRRIVNKESDNRIKNQLKHKICIAASTHANEEVFAAQTHILLKKKIKT